MDASSWVLPKGLELTDIQKDALFRLRGLVDLNPLTSRWKDDLATLHRFLKDNKYDAKKAATHLIEHATWRKENDMEKALDQPPPHESIFMLYVPQVFHKHDKVGRPIFIERTGKVDQAAMSVAMDLPESMERHKWFQELQLEKCRQSAKTRGVHVENICMIKDLDGLRSVPSTKAIGIFQQLSKMERTHYPETLGVVYIINTPWVFHTSWKMFQHFVHADTRRKLRILGPDWRDILAAELGRENLPEEYGGDCKCFTKSRSSCIPVCGESGFLHDDEGKINLPGIGSEIKRNLSRTEFSGDLDEESGFSRMNIDSSGGPAKGKKMQRVAGSETDLKKNYHGCCGRVCTLVKGCIASMFAGCASVCCRKKMQARKRDSTATDLMGHWMFT